MIWIHTEVVQSLGPLELILNTPSHHRVHHGIEEYDIMYDNYINVLTSILLGRNRKYIDKNYGGTLIIWDRLFGTFESEDSKEPVVYGLVHPVQSYNPFYLQFHLLVNLMKRIYEIKGWRNKLNVIWKGPGWAPGKPRLGDINDVPVVSKIIYPIYNSNKLI
jgi:alkylglycerol monooxygenase